MAGRLSKEAIASEFPRYYKSLSRRLYKVLEDIGASTSVRDVVNKTMRKCEILQSVCSSANAHDIISHYIFGSSFEGTTTLGLKSDVDTVILHETLPVVTTIAEAQQYTACLLLVLDSCTPAGYTKLQFVVDGVPRTGTMTTEVDLNYFFIDGEDRLIFTVPSCVFSGMVQHGPAGTMEATNFTVARDVVFAFKSTAWPNCASEWLIRERHNNWPSQEQIDKCKTLGCFFVHVGHNKSDEKHLQWRISFSLQERLLVMDFNSVQLKCYIFLKMIKNEMIHKPLGEKSLSSYHFKTCLFYMIENTPAEFWTEENLLVCLHHCLQQMLLWAETGVCPNYFIPEENMFDGRVSGQIQIGVCEILRLLLSSNFKFLLSIRTDMLGMRYQEALDSGTIASRYGQTATFYPLKSGFAVYSPMLSLRSSFFANCQSAVSLICAQELRKVKHRLLRVIRASELSIADTREALSLLLPYVDIALMSVLTVEAKHVSASNELVFNLLTSERWHAVSLEADPVSAKLKQASALCMLAYCELSLEILLGLQGRLEQQISVCGCYDIGMTPSGTFFEESLPATSECSYEELFYRYFVPCVVYLPAERDLTPPALCYEMDRSVGSPAENKRLWYDWAVVDGKVLFYFLLYLNHSHLGMEANAAADLASILRLMIAIPTQLRHFETACNILGWIYKEKGHSNLARLLFSISLSLRPTHNAACLHLRDLSRIL